MEKIYVEGKNAVVGIQSPSKPRSFLYAKHHYNQPLLVILANKKQDEIMGRADGRI